MKITYFTLFVILILGTFLVSGCIQGKAIENSDNTLSFNKSTEVDSSSQDKIVVDKRTYTSGVRDGVTETTTFSGSSYGIIDSYIKEYYWADETYTYDNMPSIATSVYYAEFYHADEAREMYDRQAANHNLFAVNNYPDAVYSNGSNFNLIKWSTDIENNGKIHRDYVDLDYIEGNKVWSIYIDSRKVNLTDENIYRYIK